MSIPLFRKLVPVNENGKRMKDSETISFVQYNMLAESYGKPQFFPHCSNGLIVKEARRPRIIEEIRMLDADVVCMQEVDSFVRFYRDAFKDMGYASAYQQRTNRKRDGSLILWKRSKFYPIVAVGVEFDNLSTMFYRTPHVDPSDSGDPSNYFLQHNVGIFVILVPFSIETNDSTSSSPTSSSLSLTSLSSSLTELSSPEVVGNVLLNDYGPSYGISRRLDQTFIVGNTHLHWNPDKNLLKLLQAQYFFSRIIEIAGSNQSICVARSSPKKKRVVYPANPSQTEENESSRIPLIYCGDINSTPHSPVYNYITGSGPYESLDLKSVLSECEMTMPASPRLCSAYSLQKTGEPPYTTKTHKFAGTLDYIFVSPSHFNVESVLELPSDQECSADTALPNSFHPSDHLSLKCVLSRNDNKL